MFDFIKSFFSTVKKNESLVFEDNYEAFQMACAYLTSSLKEGVITPAIVLDGKKIMKWPSATESLDGGKQRLLVRAAAPSGEYICVAETRGKGEALEAGDLVAFVLNQRSDFAKRNDVWAGVVVAKLDHAYIAGKWRVKSMYEKAD